MEQQLTDEQERIRLEGLRILARIIARHALDHPHLYTGGPVTGRRTQAGHSGGDAC